MILKYKCVAVHKGVGWAIADFEVENDGSVEAWSGDTPRAKMSIPVTDARHIDHFEEGVTYTVLVSAPVPILPPVAEGEFNQINVVDSPKKVGKSRTV